MSALEEARAVSLRISVTDRCQLRCLYCRPAEGVRLVDRRDVLEFEEIVDFVRLVRSRFGLSKVRITGGEPLVRRGVVSLVSVLAREGVPDLALTTNGQRLGEMAPDLRRAGLKRVNVSLDSLDEGTYRRLSRGGRLAQTLAGIDAANRAGLAPVKLNMVVLRGVNDHEVVRMARFGLERGHQVRFLEVMPIGVAAGHFDDWLVPYAEVRDKLAQEFDLTALPAESGASSRNFLARDASGRTGVLGFVSPCTAPFCRDCRRLRLTATGRLLGCLALADGIDLRPLLRRAGRHGEAQRVEAVEAALRMKRGGRRFVGQELMVGIGG